MSLKSLSLSKKFFYWENLIIRGKMHVFMLEYIQESAIGGGYEENYYYRL